jgi:hypothetical protein
LTAIGPTRLPGLAAWKSASSRLQVGQPDVELLGRTRVQRREGADDAGLALGRHQRGPLAMNIGEAMTGK